MIASVGNYASKSGRFLPLFSFAAAKFFQLRAITQKLDLVRMRPRIRGLLVEVYPGGHPQN